MSEKYPEYEVDEPVIYINGSKAELGIVKRVCGDDNYFIYYHTGDTAARTHASHLMKVSNQYAYHIVRLDPDGNERKKIVGTTTVDKAFEKFLLDTCPEVKKKLKAFEIINEKNVNVGMLKRSESVGSYHYKMDELRDKCKPLTEDEFNFLKEEMK